jgi:RNA polymerase sigma-70 factor (ECF subfamily)
MPPSLQPIKAVPSPGARFPGAPRREGPQTVRPRGRGWYDDGVGLHKQGVGVAALPPPASFDTDDFALIAALRQNDARARVAIVDRFGPYIERLVAGALGVDADLADVVNDVFVAVFERIHQLRDPGALRGWIGSLAVFTARGHIRKRRRWRWIRFFAPQDLPEMAAPTATPEQFQMVRGTYQILEGMPEDERIAFALRFISEMELTEVATACRVSLATIKRRLARAEVRFRQEAAKSPILNERMQRGRRWKNP